VRALAPHSEIKVSGASTAEKNRNIPMDIGVSRAELGYVPKYPLKEALNDYINDLRSDSAD